MLLFMKLLKLWKSFIIYEVSTIYVGVDMVAQGTSQQYGTLITLSVWLGVAVCTRLASLRVRQFFGRASDVGALQIAPPIGGPPSTYTGTLQGVLCK